MSLAAESSRGSVSTNQCSIYISLRKTFTNSLIVFTATLLGSCSPQPVMRTPEDTDHELFRVSRHSNPTLASPAAPHLLPTPADGGLGGAEGKQGGGGGHWEMGRRNLGHGHLLRDRAGAGNRIVSIASRERQRDGRERGDGAEERGGAGEGGGAGEARRQRREAALRRCVDSGAGGVVAQDVRG